jgi:hypothetical protein
MKSNSKAILDMAEIDKNVPIDHKQNVPIAREYVRSNEVQELAVEKYRKNGRGITFNDLISRGIAKTRRQAQRKLKNSLNNKVLFTIQHHKPQQYYPTCIKSHILERKNVPIDPRGTAAVLSSAQRYIIFFYHCIYTLVTPINSIIHPQHAFQAQYTSAMLYPA